MECKGKLFSKNEKERQETVLNQFGMLPPDCVSSPMDGIKCPFITGAAFVRGNKTYKIPQHGDGYHTVASNY